jgi:hypothetical protein
MPRVIVLKDEVKQKLHKQYPAAYSKISRKLQKLLDKIEISHLGGLVNCGLVLTPEGVVPDNDLGWGLHPKRYMEHCEIKAKPMPNSMLLFDDTPSQFITGSSAGSEARLTTLKFPNVCCECKAPADEIMVVETILRRSASPLSGGGQVEFSSDRARRAFLYTRFWIPLPFCAEHKNSKVSVRVFGKGKDLGGELVLCFTNLAYGKRFASANDLAYLHVTPLIALKRFVAWLGRWVTALGALGVLGCLLIDSGDLEKAIVILLGGLAMMALGLLKEKPQLPE